jgi:hypothetical protein
VAVLLLVTGTAVWWSRDRPAAPASVQAPPATRAPADPAALQRQLDGVVETGAPGVVALVRSGPQTWQGASGLGGLGAKRPEQDQVGPLGQGIHPVGPDTQQLAVEYACRQRPPPAPAAS